MKVIYNWLKEFVEFGATPAELRARLSTSGTSVDSIEESKAGPVLDAFPGAQQFGIALTVVGVLLTLFVPLVWMRRGRRP